jgi:tRNA-2-methylthio-N6-dimethylallyladenosine synthase
MKTKKLKIISAPDLRAAGKRNFKEVPKTRKANVKFTKELGLWAQGKSYCLLTFGCQANVRDAEIISAYLKNLGLVENSNMFEADLVLFNTCAIRENAENKIYGELGSLKSTCEKNPNKIVGLCGCMAQEEAPVTYVKEHFPFVNLIFGTHNIDSIYSLLDSCVTSEYRMIDVISNEGDIVEDLPSIRFDEYKAFVNIMYGCDNFCTYCIVPYTRGKQRSRSIEDVVKEVNCLIEKGYKEVTLLGQNVNAYGYDLPDGNSFDELLRQVALTKIERVRIMTSHPAYFKEAVFQVMAEYDNIMPSLHLPVQSGSDEVLKRMNRKYDSARYLELVDMLRKYIPGVYLTTDIIVGFPNETAEEFQKTLDLCNKVQFDNAYTFIYSPRAGTPAARIKDLVSKEEKMERFNQLLKIINESATESAIKQVGTTVKVLFDGYSKKDDSMISGYSEHNRLVHVKGDKSLIGQIRKVKILESHTFSLIGEIDD